MHCAKSESGDKTSVLDLDGDDFLDDLFFPMNFDFLTEIDDPRKQNIFIQTMSRTIFVKTRKQSLTKSMPDVLSSDLSGRYGKTI